MMFRQLGIMAAVSAALAFGFVGTLFWLNRDRPPPAEATIFQAFDTGGTGRVTLANGWSATGRGGRVMTEAAATLELPTGGGFHDPVHLVLALQAVGATNTKEADYKVSVNGEAVGSFPATQGSGVRGYHFRIPPSLANRQYPMQVAVRAGKPFQTGFRLVWLRLTDEQNQSRGFRGFLDACRPGVLGGWAADDIGPAKLQISINGRPLPQSRIVYRKRNDLVRAGVTAHAGFFVRFAKPLPKGTQVEVKSLQGANLRNSPCTI